MLINIWCHVVNSVVTTRNSYNIPTNDTDTSVQFENYVCPALPTEMVAIRRSRGQHGTHQPLYEVMAVVHLMYSLQPENTDILQNNIKGYPSVTTLMVSYSAVVNQLAQQRLYHHIQAEFVVMSF